MKSLVHSLQKYTMFDATVDMFSKQVEFLNPCLQTSSVIVNSHKLVTLLIQNFGKHVSKELMGLVIMESLRFVVLPSPTHVDAHDCL